MELCKFGSRESGRCAWRMWAGAVAALWLSLAGLAAWAQDDPPGRVGRLNFVQGEVSFSPAGSDEWVEARSSRPITSGDRIWMDRGARSELSIGSAVLRSDGETSLKVLQLDDDQAQFQLSEGTLAVHVRSLDQDDRLEIATPDLAFVIDRPGDYRLRVDPNDGSTEVTVRNGQGWAYAEDGRHRLDAPAYARFVGERLDRVSGDLPGRDGFDRWVEARIDRIEARPAVRYVGRDMVGYEDLDDYGSWRQEADYGWVWTPRITIAAWAPYRYGHWAWIAPWGWTWVDDAPWGFAPFHYGRWAYVRSRWCWVPGPIVRRPYYAPALVAFVGGSTGWHHRGSRGPAVAWFPLGPREEYRPVYRASTTYVTRINQVVIVERERGGRRGQPDQFVNRHIPGAATAIPTRAFVEGRPVGREHLHGADQELRQASVAGTMPTLAPVKASLVGESRRISAPPRQERERQVITTRMPAPPPVERDELAKRFAQGGGVVSGAGPSLAEQIRRSEDRQDKRPRVVTQRREDTEGPDLRRLSPGAVQSPQADQPREGERERPNREPRGQAREQAIRPEAVEQPRRPQEGREADRAQETPRGTPEPRREGEEGPRESRSRQESPRGPEAAPARPHGPDRLEELVRQRERAESQRPAEPRAAPEPRRERGLEPERGAAERPAAPATQMIQPDRGQARPERPQEERPPREVQEQRQMRMEPRVRESSPEPERRVADRPASPAMQIQPERAQPRSERPQEERPPREIQEQRQMRMERMEPRVQESRPERAPQPQIRQERPQPRIERPEPERPREAQPQREQQANEQRSRPEPRGGEGGRERKERERNEQAQRPPGQPE